MSHKYQNEMDLTRNEYQNYQPQTGSSSGTGWSQLPKKGEERKYRFLLLKGGDVKVATYTHWNLKNSKGKPLRCPGQECPICYFIKDKPEHRERLESTPRFNCLVLEFENNSLYPKPDPKILGVPPGTFDTLINILNDDDMVSIFDPYNGSAVKISRGDNNFLNVIPLGKPMALAQTEKDVDAIMDSRPNLKEILSLKDYHLTEAEEALVRLRNSLQTGSKMNDTMTGNSGFNSGSEIPF